MRADMRGPTTRFRRRRGRQGNRRQQLSSAVAREPTRGRERRPLPHFPAEAGERPTPTLASPTSGRPPLLHPQSPKDRGALRRGVAIGVSGAGLAPQGKTTTTAPREKAHLPDVSLDPNHYSHDNTASLFPTLHPLPTPKTEAGTCHCQEPRNPLSSVLSFSVHPTPKHLPQPEQIQL